MGLTTSRESIERHVCPVETEPEPGYPTGCEEPPAVAESQVATGIRLDLEGVPSLPQITRKKRRADTVKPTMKKKLAADETPKRRLEGNEPQKKRKKPTQAKDGGKSPSAPSTSGPRRAVSKKETVPTANDAKSKDDMDISAPEPLEEAPRQPMNAHRVKIRMGKEALAAIKEGTRIYIKSGEGNGGDTWWDSGVIRKIHGRGKPFEVEWESHNNRGEEVDTDVERRIGLPVTYSLAGAAAEAIREAEPGTQAAILARKSVLAEARIGSWCIKHPEEPWGMLDPFGEDSMAV